MTWGCAATLLLVLLIGYTVGGAVMLWKVRDDDNNDDE